MIDPADAMFALYPPSAEPDWETLDLDSDLWQNFFVFEEWKGERCPCSGYWPSARRCTVKRSAYESSGLPVCRRHHHNWENQHRIDEIWRRRWNDERNPYNPARVRGESHLIHAAPELYEALEAIAALDDGDEPFIWRHPKQFKQVHAALAKARGESQ